MEICALNYDAAPMKILAVSIGMDSICKCHFSGYYIKIALTCLAKFFFQILTSRFIENINLKLYDGLPFIFIKRGCLFIFHIVYITLQLTNINIHVYKLHRHNNETLQSPRNLAQ